MKKLRNLAIFLALIATAYLLGPKYSPPAIDPQAKQPALNIETVEGFVQKKEAAFSLKPDNEARIVWAGSSHAQTDFSVVYLHGFSASQEEGNPVHREFAERYGCNLYLARLPFHGVADSNAFQNITPDTLVDGALEALQIGRALGKKVILMGCSTGGSLAIYLAAHHPDIAALVLYSPNIDIADPAAGLLTMPWGKQMAHMASGGDYHRWNGTKRQLGYWQTTYRIEGLLAVKSLVERTMVPEIFKKVEQPVFMGYYFRDEKNQDGVVSVPAMRRFFDQLGTPPALKKQVAFPEANEHVIAYHELSRDVPGVLRETFAWAETVLGLRAGQ